VHLVSIEVVSDNKLVELISEQDSRHHSFQSEARQL
jgi:hypothetical protein